MRCNATVAYEGSKMHDELLDATSKVANRFLSILGDPEVQADLRTLAEAVLRAIPDPDTSRPNPDRGAQTDVESTDKRVRVENSIVNQPRTNPQGKPELPHGPRDTTRQGVARRTDPIVADADDGSATLPPAVPSKPKIRIKAPSEPVVTAAEAKASLFPSHNESCVVDSKSALNDPDEKPIRIRRFDSAHGEVDLSLIVKRMRLKAEGARWSSERRQMASQGQHLTADITQGDRDIIERARAIEGCYLWMNNRAAPEPSDLSLFDQLGDAFEVCADAVALMQRVVSENDDDFRQVADAAELLAEAQSMLRTAVLALPHDSDSDQLEIFRWLRELCRIRRIKIARYMTVGDRADPERWEDLAVRIQLMEGSVAEFEKVRRQRSKLLGKIAYEAGQIRERPDDFARRSVTVLGSIDQLIEAGLPPRQCKVAGVVVADPRSYRVNGAAFGKPDGRPQGNRPIPRCQSKCRRAV